MGVETVLQAPGSVPRDTAEDPQTRCFAALYRREFAFVWAAARHLGVAPAVIDDVVQDVFLTAYRRLDHLRFEVSPRAWLFGVTRRVAFRYRRGAARRARRHAAFAEVVAPDPAPHQRHDDARQLEHLLARLGAATREVWQMTELLGMSAPEIASELGLPLNTVYSRLRLAREQLKVQAGAELETLRDETRRRSEAPAGAPQRTWALLLPALGERGAGLGVLAFMKAQTAMTTTMIAAGVVVVGLVVRPRPPATAGPGTLTSATIVVGDAQRSPGVDGAVVASEVRAPVTVPRLSARTGARSVEAQARLAEEVALIDRVHAQLAAAELDGARASIDAHARRFPDGALADVREAARIESTCRGGDAATAEAHARRLVIALPASAVAQRFANYRCPW